jgi:hypothetical protein
MHLQPAVPNPLDRRSPQGNRSPVDDAGLQKKRLRRPGWAGGDKVNRATIRYAKTAGQFLRGCLGLAALTFMGLRLGFTVAAVGFCYLVLIECMAVFDSFIACVALAVISVGCLNYFFVPPLSNFRVDDVQDAVALIAFLLTLIVITALATKIGTDAPTREAVQRAMINTIPAMIWRALPDGSRERGRSATAEYRLFQTQAAPQRDARGQMLKWHGRSIDIEERKRDLEALRQSEEAMEGGI